MKCKVINGTTKIQNFTNKYQTIILANRKLWPDIFEKKKEKKLKS